MNRRDFIIALSSSSIVGIAGCMDTDTTSTPEFTPESGKQNLTETDESIEYPPGLAINRIDIETVMDHTPLLRPDTEPQSVSFKSIEQLTENGSTDLDRTINGKIDINAEQMYRKRTTTNRYTERFKIENSLFEASFSNNSIEEVTELSNNATFDPLSDSGYGRIVDLVSPFSVESHVIKKDTTTDRLVHLYKSETSTSSLPVTELEVAFYENGLINYITVYYTNTEKIEYSFTMNFSLYDDTEVTVPDWYSEK